MNTPNQLPDTPMLKELKQKTIEAYETLVVDGNQNPNIVPEEIFVNYFLPYFCGEKKIEPDQRILTEWIGIAGTPMMPVDVVDDAGQVLCRVPPLLDTSVLEVVNLGLKQSFKMITEQYQMQQTHIPAVAETGFVKNLEDKFKSYTKPSENYPQFSKDWETVFERFGKNPKPTNTADNGSQKESNLDGDVIYE